MIRRSIAISLLVLVTATLLLVPSAIAETGDEGSIAMITGQTLDAYDQSLPGVTVILETGKHTISNADGYFNIYTSQGDHMMSFYKENYTSKTMPVTIPEGQDTLSVGSIQLMPDINPNQNMVFAIFVVCSMFIVFVLAFAFWRRD